MKRNKITAILTSVILLTLSPWVSANTLTVSSWNIEWLTLNPSAPKDKGKRSEQDFAALRQHFAKLNSDVLAFQEVDSIDAVENVVGPGYHVVLSDRSQPNHAGHQFGDINQYTGFAVRNGIPFRDPPDIDLYDKRNHKLRFAAYIVLYPDTPNSLHTLSVHLKAGCSGKFQSNQSSCQTLLKQGKALNAWIKQRESKQEAYLIMGDFNHNLAYRGDWLWQTMTQGTKAEPTLASQQTQATCKVRSRQQANKLHQFRSLIDHVIISPNLKADEARQVNFDSQQVLSYQLSDHCPLSSQVSW
ncbi:endonuclease/exonuclease/phosphatase family protein [Vibrio fluvialis]|nr:endonuclease/exonuclease/phosphatase family protein [Vibrio fluvialis]